MILAAADKGIALVIHQNLAISVLLYLVAIGIWGVFQYLRGRNPSGSYLGALILAEGLILVQGLLGIVLVAQGHRPKEGLHYLYGAAAVLALPGVYFSPWVARGTDRRDSLILGLTAIFIVGLAVRGIVTGGSSG
jgi:heme A synthase